MCYRLHTPIDSEQLLVRRRLGALLRLEILPSVLWSILNRMPPIQSDAITDNKVWRYTVFFFLVRTVVFSEYVTNNYSFTRCYNLRPIKIFY